MASIMIYVKNNDLLMPVLGSWANNGTGSVIICWWSVMVKTLYIYIYIYREREREIAREREN